jgi:predicted lipoprotein with Yx(FWY)xxD motif
MKWETRNRTPARTWVAAIAALAALAAVAAGAALAAPGSSSQPSGAGTLIKVQKTGLGRVLVDGRGRTLYLFEADHGTTSACYGKCATFWPPLLTTGKPQAGAGTKAALLGTTKRKNGALQVTYHRHPLYRFFKDTKPGQTTGQGVSAFGAEWYVLNGAGAKVEAKQPAGDNNSSPTTTTGTTTDQSGGGYGGGYG